MKQFMIYSFYIASIWDGFTTAIGIAAIFGASTILGYIFCFIGGLVIFGLGVGTKTIFGETKSIYKFIKIIWLISVFFDFYTSFLGNARYIILRDDIMNFKDIEL